MSENIKFIPTGILNSEPSCSYSHMDSLTSNSDTSFSTARDQNVLFGSNATALEDISLSSEPDCETASTVSLSAFAKISNPNKGLDQVELAFTTIDSIISKYYLLPALHFITDIIKFEDEPGCRLSALICLANLYFPDASRDAIGKLMSFNGDIASGFSLIKELFSSSLSPFFGGVDESQTIQSTPQSPSSSEAGEIPVLERLATMEQTLSSGLTQIEGQIKDFRFSPVAGFAEVKSSAPNSIARFMEDNSHILRPVMGIIAYAAAIFGLSELLTFDFISQQTKNVVKLANTIKAKNIIVTEVNEGVDAFFDATYNWCGATYIKPSAQRLHKLSTRIDEVQALIRDFVTATELDVLGYLRTEQISTLDIVIASMEKEYNAFSENEKSLFNFRDRLSALYKQIEVLRERRVNIFQTISGKQEPVTLWMGGVHGCGKTTAMGRINQAIISDIGGHIYTRNKDDKYCSNWSSPSLVYTDDMGSILEQIDVMEWHNHASAAYTTILGAAIEQKGKPFTGRVMTTSSNMMYVISSPKIYDLGSINRRRMYLVYAQNPSVAKYKHENHAQSPPGSFYTADKMEYFLFDPEHMLNSKGNSIPQGFIDIKHPGCIGRVTESELIDMVVQRERYETEIFRRKLYKLQQECKLPPGINVSGIPIEYDENRFRLENIFDGEGNRKERPGPPHFDIAEVEYARPSSVSSSSSYISQEEYALTASSLLNIASHVGVPTENLMDFEELPEKEILPTQPQILVGRIATPQVRQMPIILAGPPGVGKTHLIRQIFQGDYIYKLTYNEKIEDLPKNKILWCDDFTINEERASIARTIAHDYDECTLICNGVIMTANTQLASWTSESSTLIKRRSTVITIEPDFRMAMSMKFGSHKNCESYLEGKDTQARSKCLKITSTAKYQPKSYAELPTYIRYMLEEKTEKENKVVRDFPFTLPHPEEFDILCTACGSYDELRDKKFGYDDIKLFEAYNYKEGKLSLMSGADRAYNIVFLGPLLKTEAYGTIDNFIMAFNSENRTTNRDFPHTLIRFIDVTLGFIQSPNDKTIKCYRVSTAYTEQISIMDGEIRHAHELHFKDKHNSSYYDILEKMGSTSGIIKPLIQCPVDIDPTKLPIDIWHQSPLYTLYSLFIGVASLGIKFGCAYSLISSIKRYGREQVTLPPKVPEASKTRCIITTGVSHIHICDNCSKRYEHTHSSLTWVPKPYHDQWKGDCPWCQGNIMATKIEDECAPPSPYHAPEVEEHLNWMREHGYECIATPAAKKLISLEEAEKARQEESSESEEELPKRKKKPERIQSQHKANYKTKEPSNCSDQGVARRTTAYRVQVNQERIQSQHRQNGKQKDNDIPSDVEKKRVAAAKAAHSNWRIREHQLQSEINNLKKKVEVMQVQTVEKKGDKVIITLQEENFRLKMKERMTTTKLSKESIDSTGNNIDGTIVLHKDGHYGVMYNARVVYAHEFSNLTWKVLNTPLTPQWVEVDISSLPTRAKTAHGGIVVLFNRKKMDALAIRETFGHIFTLVDHTIDLGSIFAFAFGCGIPYDVDSTFIHPSLFITLFSDPALRIPKSCQNYMSSVFKDLKFDRKEIPLSEEAMVDPQLTQETKYAQKAQCTIYSEGQKCCHGLLIKDNLGITVGHVPSHTKLSMRTMSSENNYPIEIIHRNKVQDVAVFKIMDPHYQSHVDITSHIISKTDFEKVISRQLKDIPVRLSIPVIENRYFNVISGVGEVRTKLHSYNPGTGDYRVDVGNLGVSGISEPGDCGGVYLFVNKTLNAKICGIHRAGNPTVSECSHITREFVVRLLNKEVMEEALIPTKVTEGIIMKEQSVKCHQTGLQWVGDVYPACYTPSTTRVHRTGILIEEYDLHQPSIMNKFDPRNEDQASMLNEGAARYGRAYDRANVDDSRIENAFREIGNYICNKLQAAGKDVRVLTKTEAINKPPWEEYPKLNEIDRSGSVGFPYCNSKDGRTSKGDYLYQNQNNKQWYFKLDKVSQKISKRVDQIVDDAKKGIPHIHPFITYLKDEVLKEKKIRGPKRKTRVFFSGPFDHLLAYRKYFLAAMGRIHEINATIPIKVGTSQHQHDWNTMAWRFLRVGDMGFASDMENFDASVYKKFVECNVIMYNMIYQRLDPNWKPEDDVVRTTLHKAAEGAHIIVNNKLYKLDQAVISGICDTAIGNSADVWALYYIVWLDLAEVHAPELANFASFMKLVELGDYGDDNACTIAPEVRSWFHFNNFKREAAKYGFCITDAEKKGGAVPDLVPFEELSFLKRKFKLNQGWYTAPLELASIGKMLHWVKGTSSYTIKKEHVDNWPLAPNRDVAAQSIDQCWSEIAMHGKEFYEEMVAKILKSGHLAGLELHPPLWQTAMAAFGYHVC